MIPQQLNKHFTNIFFVSDFPDIYSDNIWKMKCDLVLGYNCLAL